MANAALAGTRLRERRQAAGLKQGTLAARAGISPSYLNLIEHNRRKVTPDILLRLAEALGVDPQVLSEGAGSELADDLRAAAAGVPGAGAELDRLEEFAGRFPGWAAVTAALQARAGSLERAVVALNDRMTHDPHLSAALHELLSALTGVRAAAEILAETNDLEPDLMRRFQRNLYRDSERLAGGAEALVAFLDGSDTPREQGIAAPQEEVEDWLRARGWHLDELDSVPPSALDAELGELASSAARSLARTLVARAAADAQALPLAPFRAAYRKDPDPGRLAAQFGVDVLTVMRRIALVTGPETGFVTCDGSGTLLFRKPVAGFALPRFGAACPLWPLYAALVRPGVPVRAVVSTTGPASARFQVLAWCQTRLSDGFGGPVLREAAMLILPDMSARPAETLVVGSTCRICPREDCAARREPSIMREGM